MTIKKERKKCIKSSKNINNRIYLNYVIHNISLLAKEIAIYSASIKTYKIRLNRL